MPNIGPLEIAIVLVILLLVFGSKRIPELGSSLGRGIRGFGKGLKGEDEEHLGAGAETLAPGAGGSKQSRDVEKEG